MAHDPGLERFLGWRQVRELTGLGRTTAWRMRQAGAFPDPVLISPGRVAWRAGDIAAWNESRGPTTSAPSKPEALVRNSPPSAASPAVPPPIAPPAPPSVPGLDRPPPARALRATSPARRRRRAPLAEGQLGFDF